MDDELDLYILRANDQGQAIVLARYESDLAIASLGCETLGRLGEFRERIAKAIKGEHPRPSSQELARFGDELFRLVVRGDVLTLYDRLPDRPVRIQIVSDHPALQSLPWEYWRDSSVHVAPRRDRSIVRIVPTIGRNAPDPVKFHGKRPLRILFAYADPMNAGQVSWEELRCKIEDTLQKRLPSVLYQMETVKAEREAIADRIAYGGFDVFHFSGHGDVDNEGYGRLRFLDHRNPFIRANQLAQGLHAKGIRLVVLSACETADGDFSRPFAVIAQSLIHVGIPAVVAYQLPVPDATVAAFVGAFYTELVKSGDVDQAMAEGRSRLDFELDYAPHATLEWGIPTLYRHCTAMRLFKREEEPA